MHEVTDRDPLKQKKNCAFVERPSKKLQRVTMSPLQQCKII